MQATNNMKEEKKVEAPQAAAPVVSPFQQLFDEGYQVIEEPVLTADECKQLVSEWWDWAESLNSGIDRNDPTAGKWPANIHGIIQYPSAAHIIPVWRARTHPKVVAKFAELWGVKPEDLLVSFDRMNVQRPSSRNKPQKGWLHIDQGARIANSRCYQGLIPLIDMPQEAGTLVVMPGSHKLHKELFQRFPDEVKKSKDNWLRFNEDELKWLEEEHKLKTVRTSAKAGQLVLWDSRTAHQGSYALPGVQRDHWRMVVYVCMKPKPKPRNNGKDRINLEKAMAKKRKVFLEGRTTSHWPGPEPLAKRTKTGNTQLSWQPIKCFPDKPRTWGKEDALIEEPPTAIKVRTTADLRAIGGDLALSLAGFPITTPTNPPPLE
jgi:hypothetical protein